jgi:single-stranded DNA-binding protein
MLNKVILIGHLGKEPETRHSQNGKKIVNFSLATTEKYNSVLQMLDSRNNSPQSASVTSEAVAPSETSSHAPTAELDDQIPF